MKYNLTLKQVTNVLIGVTFLTALFAVHPTQVVAATQSCSCTAYVNYQPTDCSMDPGQSDSLRSMGANLAKYSWSCIGLGGAYCSPSTYPSGSNQDGYTTVYCVGTGQVSVSSNVSASWTITGPATISGSGTSQSASSEPLGTYTITWGAVSGKTTPASQSLTIANAGDTISFSGTYAAASPAVQVYFN